MKVAVVGAGYVGLVSGACFAEYGNDVVCVDNNAARLNALRRGVTPIYEPGLTELVKRNVAAGRLSFSDRIGSSISGVDIVFLAVGTPAKPGDGEADLSQVFGAAKEIARYAEDGLVVATKSTVPVDTGAQVDRVIRSARPDLRFSVVSNPEFLKEGTAISDFMQPDRIVIGAEHLWAARRVAELYRPLTDSGAPMLITGRSTAEVIKYASNAFLATKISFINEMADFCEATGAEISDVADAIGLDRRIGRSFLNAGPGYGGSCFPKDSRALLSTAQRHQVSLRIVESSIAVNEARKKSMGARILRAMGGSVDGKRVAILGLTFKPGTDDMRESPALTIIGSLQEAGAKVAAYDPKGMESASKMVEDVEFFADAYSCAECCDGVVLATEWPEFLALDFTKLASVMNGRVFVDLRNAVPREKLLEAGFTLHGIGSARKLPIATLIEPASTEHAPTNGRKLPEGWNLGSTPSVCQEKSMENGPLSSRA
jgi:UDPglucose 6-dehydrogenase